MLRLLPIREIWWRPDPCRADPRSAGRGRAEPQPVANMLCRAGEKTRAEFGEKTRVSPGSRRGVTGLVQPIVHSRTMPSALPLVRTFSCGANVNESTELVWPASGWLVGGVWCGRSCPIVVRCCRCWRWPVFYRLGRRPLRIRCRCGRSGLVGPAGGERQPGTATSRSR